MNGIDVLISRNSAVRLAEPAPNAEERESLWRAALRAPDHGRLRPWRLLVIEGEGRQRFGEAMARVGALNNPEQTTEEAEKLKGKALRAPLLVVVAAHIQENPKVPENEQLLSAGCAAMNILNACHALGYGAVWRTGNLIYHPQMCASLGLDPDSHRLVAVLYIGTHEGNQKTLRELDSGEYVASWSG